MRWWLLLWRLVWPAVLSAQEASRRRRQSAERRARTLRRLFEPLEVRTLLDADPLPPCAAPSVVEAEQTSEDIAVFVDCVTHRSSPRTWIWDEQRNIFPLVEIVRRRNWSTRPLQDWLNALAADIAAVEQRVRDTTAPLDDQLIGISADWQAVDSVLRHLSTLTTVVDTVEENLNSPGRLAAIRLLAGELYAESAALHSVLEEEVGRAHVSVQQELPLVESHGISLAVGIEPVIDQGGNSSADIPLSRPIDGTVKVTSWAGASRGATDIIPRSASDLTSSSMARAALDAVTEGTLAQSLMLSEGQQGFLYESDYSHSELGYFTVRTDTRHDCPPSCNYTYRFIHVQDGLLFSRPSGQNQDVFGIEVAFHQPVYVAGLEIVHLRGTQDGVLSVFPANGLERTIDLGGGGEFIVGQFITGFRINRINRSDGIAAGRNGYGLKNIVVSTPLPPGDPWGQPISAFDPPAARGKVEMYPYPPLYSALVFPISENRLLSVPNNGPPSLWDEASGASIGEFGDGVRPYLAAASPSGRRAAFVPNYGSGIVHVWNLSGEAPVLEFTFDNIPGVIDRLAFVGDDSIAVFVPGVGAPAQRGIHLLDIISGNVRRLIDLPEGPIAGSPNGELVAASDGSQTVMIEAASAAEIWRSSPGTVQAVAFHPSGEFVAAASNNSTAIYRVSNGALVDTLPFGSTWALSLSFVGDDFLVSGDRERLYVARVGTDGHASVMTTHIMPVSQHPTYRWQEILSVAAGDDGTIFANAYDYQTRRSHTYLIPVPTETLGIELHGLATTLDFATSASFVMGASFTVASDPSDIEVTASAYRGSIKLAEQIPDNEGRVSFADEAGITSILVRKSNRTASLILSEISVTADIHHEQLEVSPVSRQTNGELSQTTAFDWTIGGSEWLPTSEITRNFPDGEPGVSECHEVKP